MANDFLTGCYIMVFSSHILFGFDSGAALATVLGMLAGVTVMLSLVKNVNATQARVTGRNAPRAPARRRSFRLLKTGEYR